MKDIHKNNIEFSVFHCRVTICVPSQMHMCGRDMNDDNNIYHHHNKLTNFREILAVIYEEIL